MTPDDDGIVRTIIDLPEAQLEALARLCSREGISRAEAVRRAVAAFVVSGEASDAQQKRKAAFGLWRGRQPDGRRYVEALRAEWEESK